MAITGLGRDDRIVSRHVNHAPIEFRTAVGRPVVAEILDLSEFGVRILSAKRLAVGLRLWIKLPGLESREAEVIWCAEGEVGCRFIYPLQSATINLLVTPTKPRHNWKILGSSLFGRRSV